MSNMTLTVKNIVAIALSGAAIFGCLALFINVTRSRELGQREGDNTTDFLSVFDKVVIFTPRLPY
mgnify:CR=1 FL=1